MGKPDGGDEQDEEGGERRLAWIVLLSLPVEIEQSRSDEQKRERDDPVRDSMEQEHARGRDVRMKRSRHELFSIIGVASQPTRGQDFQLNHGEG